MKKIFSLMIISAMLLLFNGSAWSQYVTTVPLTPLTPVVVIQNGLSKRAPAGAVVTAGLPGSVTLLGLGAGTDGAAAGHTVLFTDDTADTTFAAIDAGSTVSVNTTLYRTGSASLQVVFKTTATVASGVHSPESSIVMTSETSAGVFLYSTISLAAGDLNLKITNTPAGLSYGVGSPTVTLISVPAVAAGKWTWVEIPLSGTRAAVTDIGVVLGATGVTKAAAGSFGINLDFLAAWASSDELALSVVPIDNGVLGVTGLVWTMGGGDYTAELASVTTKSLALGADYFVAYRASGAALVCVSDLSKTAVTALIAY